MGRGTGAELAGPGETPVVTGPGGKLAAWCSVWRGGGTRSVVVRETA
jgi:hypothetical protein